VDLDDVGTLFAIGLGVVNSAWLFVAHKQRREDAGTADVVAHVVLNPQNPNRELTLFEAVITNRGPALAQLVDVEVLDVHGANLRPEFPEGYDRRLHIDLARDERHTVPVWIDLVANTSPYAVTVWWDDGRGRQRRTFLSGTNPR
jgi:hypothetical protein